MNYQLWVAFKLRVNQSNLEADISFIRVGKNDESWSLMLQVTKKIQFDENIMSWWKYYKLTIILWVDKSTVSWGKLKAVVK